MIAHVTLAGVTNTPEMELSEDESKILASGIVPVLDQFDFVPDPKITAVIGLIAASARVYGPRVYLIRARLQAEKDAAMKNVSPKFGTI